MTKYKDCVYAIFPKTGGGRAFETDIGVCQGDEYQEIRGLVETPHGFVNAYSMYWKGHYCTSSIEMIKDGRTHTRSFNKAFTSRGLVTKGKQFAAELHTNEG